ncbi:DUF736 domain-containing protein [Caulobacter sp. SSI4214]|uniref:DUF736 domain-containing protein n=1 Tax=Caulobacter sp. SSI4214 TaxID=2575739 RepID=UPI0014393EAD|nr:DUF736 domain-containing protein [Caulobacter sp. SSI4214]
MSTIGHFTATPDGYTGAIRSLKLSIKNVRLRAVECDDAKKQPAFRISAGTVELGAAWKRKSRAGNDYLLFKLDDPSFPAPVFARLHAAEEGFDLVWSRPTKPGQPDDEEV